MNENPRDRFYRSFYSRYRSQAGSQSPFEIKPLSPLARIGLVLLTVAILAVSFMLGLVFLAIAVGLVAMGLIAMGIQRLLSGKPKPPEDDDIEVSYRVIHRKRDE